MADNMMRTQQDNMVLEFFKIVDVFGSLNMAIDAVLSSKSTGLFGVSFGHI